MDKIKILVACHKPCEVYHDDVYTPIHVGRAISKYKDEMSWMIGDDTGDNISEKNGSYCELTAQYWAWKNLKDVEYIGIAHYRRYFQQLLTSEGTEDSFWEKYDVVLCRPLYEKIPVDIRLKIATSEEDSAIFFSSIKRVSPDYYESVIKFFSGNKVIPYNMFVMKKTEFDRFAEWQFRILFEMEKNIRLSPYSRGRRIFGYYAEMLLPIYCLHNRFRIFYSPVVSMVGEKVKVNKFVKLLRDFYCNAVFLMARYKRPRCGEPCKIGLKQDGIECLID